jgi:hypothetical protein
MVATTAIIVRVAETAIALSVSVVEIVIGPVYVGELVVGVEPSVV